MKLDVETARELAYGQPGQVINGFTVVENEIMDTSRWSVNYRLVILNRYNNTYWKTWYSEGATEYQDEQPFDEFYNDYSGGVEFHEVEPVEVVRVEYREVS